LDGGFVEIPHIVHGVPIMTDSEKLTKLSKMGRGRFVLLFGVLGWGIPTAILFALLQSYQNAWDGFLFQLIPALVLFPIGGYVWGRVMWKFLERRHGKASSVAVTK
jgi:hypothetical protein